MNFLCKPIESKLNDPRWKGLDKTPIPIEAKDEEDCYKQLRLGFGNISHTKKLHEDVQASPWCPDLVKCSVVEE